MCRRVSEDVVLYHPTVTGYRIYSEELEEGVGDFSDSKNVTGQTQNIIVLLFDVDLQQSS